MSIKKQLWPYQKGKEVTDGTLNMIEMAFRAYDPCFGCATHALPGQRPIQLNIYDTGGELLSTRYRN
jgi:F420-non-reducing hydrogenase large subunit